MSAVKKSTTPALIKLINKIDAKKAIRERNSASIMIDSFKETALSPKIHLILNHLILVGVIAM